MIDGSEQFDHRFLARARYFSRAAAIFVILVGVMVLTGWLFDISRLKTHYAGITMKANTALGLVLAGTSLCLLNFNPQRKVAQIAGQVCAAILALIGFLTLTEHIIGWDLGIDQLMFTEPPGALDTTSPGRMGPPASTCFTLSGIALLLLHRGRFLHHAQLLAVFVGLWAMLAIVGYAYNAHAFYNIARFTGIALPTAVALMVFSLGLLATRVDQGITAVISSSRAGGLMARRLLFMILTVPFLLGWLRVTGERAGYYDLGFGTATLVLAIIIIFAAVTWRSAAKLSSVEQKQLTAESIVREKDQGLRRQLSFDEAVMANMGEGLYTVNDQGLVTFMNPAAERLFGWKLDELRGRKMHDVTHHHHRDGSPFPIEECAGFQILHQGEPLINYEDVFIRKDGSFFDVRYSSSPILEADKITGLVVVFRDITERKLAEERLRENARMQRILAQIGELAARVSDAGELARTVAQQVALEFQASRCGYASVDVGAGEIVIENDFHGELPSVAGTYRLDDSAQHYRDDGLAGRITAVDDLITDPRTANLYEERYKPIGVAALINVPLHRDNNWLANFWISHHEPRAWSSSEVALMRVIADRVWLLMERKEAHEERERLLASEQLARKQAETANRMKDEFLTTVSHELRTPLNAILGWSSMLQGGKLSAADSQRALESIERNARAQAQIVEDILDVSRTVSGKLRLDIKPIQLIPVIKTAVDSIRPAAQAKDLQLELQLDPAADHIQADGARLQQVVWNLLANAVKFSSTRGKIQIALQRVDTVAQITVTDNGDGISADFLPKVFNPFQQADGSMTRRHGGLGLGLAIARHLVEMHGGSIEAWSDGPGHGATFTVRVPVASLATESLPSLDPVLLRPTEVRNDPGLLCLNGIRILAIDDEADARQMLKTLLESSGADVLTASSAREAMEALREWEPHVLICDIGMPEEDGYSFIQKVRCRETNSGGRIPAIALTGYVRVEERMRALEAGYQMFVPKPVEATELTSIIVGLVQNAAGV